MYDNDVIKIVNNNAEAIKTRKKAEAAYRNYVKTVKSRIVSYIGFEAIMAVFMFIDWIAPVLCIPIMLITLFTMGVDIGMNYQVFLPRN